MGTGGLAERVPYCVQNVCGYTIGILLV